MLVILIEGTYGVWRWGGFMWYGIRTKLMNTDAGVQTIRCSLGNLRGCNAGIAEGRDL
jgi:hypothetical protein